MQCKIEKDKKYIKKSSLCVLGGTSKVIPNSCIITGVHAYIALMTDVSQNARPARTVANLSAF